MYSTYRKWPNQSGKGDGVVIGADLTQEWLLPWWWENYRHFNKHPVAFVDLGLSSKMKAWCKERGQHIRLPIPDVFVAEKEELDLKKTDAWEEKYGKTFWQSRSAWFKKPLACLQTPFERSIWIDLDCEIRGSISPLFCLSDHPSGISMARELYEKPDPDESLYNSGVIAFQRGIALFEKWADDALDRNQLFPGDQNALSHSISKDNLSIGELPLIYNWSRYNPENADAIVLHWHGVHGKSIIAHQIAKKRLSEL